MYVDFYRLILLILEVFSNFFPMSGIIVSDESGKGGIVTVVLGEQFLLFLSTDHY